MKKGGLLLIELRGRADVVQNALDPSSVFVLAGLVFSRIL